jgi:hypothetical protein
LVRDVLRDVEGVRPAQCVLQDRGEVIEEAKAAGRGLEGVVLMEHDFHEEQPVKGEWYWSWSLGIVTDLDRGAGLHPPPDIVRLLGCARHQDLATSGGCSAG